MAAQPALAGARQLGAVLAPGASSRPGRSSQLPLIEHHALGWRPHGSAAALMAWRCSHLLEWAPLCE
eukprot:363309-Chlamydomonas_euryale.AAC.16